MRKNVGATLHPGRTFHFTRDGSRRGGKVEQYGEEKVRGEVFRCRHHTGEKVNTKESGHLLTVLSSGGPGREEVPPRAAGVDSRRGSEAGGVGTALVAF